MYHDYITAGTFSRNSERKSLRCVTCAPICIFTRVRLCLLGVLIRDASWTSAEAEFFFDSGEGL